MSKIKSEDYKVGERVCLGSSQATQTESAVRNRVVADVKRVPNWRTQCSLALLCLRFGRDFEFF